MAIPKKLGAVSPNNNLQPRWALQALAAGQHTLSTGLLTEGQLMAGHLPVQGTSCEKPREQQQFECSDSTAKSFPSLIAIGRCLNNNK
eukprot:990419-Pelagomonas_calceolata.AAC.5